MTAPILMKGGEKPWVTTQLTEFLHKAQDTS